MKWILTQPDDGEPELDVREGDEDLSLGFAYLRALADQPEPTWIDSGSGPGYFRSLPRADD